MLNDPTEQDFSEIAILKNFLLNTFVGKLCTHCVAALKQRPIFQSIENTGEISKDSPAFEKKCYNS